MKENLQSKQEKSLAVFNLVVVRIMINMNQKKRVKIKVNQQDLLLELDLNMEDLVVKILLNLDIITRINLGLMEFMIHIQRDSLQTPVKSEILKKMTRNLKK
jgi:hypothetical protein